MSLKVPCLLQSSRLQLTRTVLISLTELWGWLTHFWWSEKLYLKVPSGTSLVVQLLRIHLPMQGTRVRTLVQEDPTCRRASKPARHHYWACALQPTSHNYWAHTLQLLKPAHSRAHVLQLLKPVHLEHALQQEKTPQWEARTPQQRVAPVRHN